jgi:hypothetical protein
MKENKSSATEPTIVSEGQIPSDQDKSNLINNGDTPVSPLIDLESIRIDQTTIDKAVAKKLTTVVHLVRKPKKQEFFRVHPSPEYRLPAAILELEEAREI